jgi:hypothetical protein
MCGPVEQISSVEGTTAGSGLNAVKSLKARDANSQVKAFALLVEGFNSGKLDDILMKQTSSQVVVKQDAKDKARGLLVEMTSGKLDDILKKEAKSKVAADPYIKQKARGLLVDLPPLTAGKLDDILKKTSSEKAAIEESKQKAHRLLVEGFNSGKIDAICSMLTNQTTAEDALDKAQEMLFEANAEFVRSASKDAGTHESGAIVEFVRSASKDVAIQESAAIAA